jgi:hypothetical protein
MKDLLEFLWRSLSRYVPQLSAMVIAPKSTILTAIAREDRFEAALTFTAVTVALAFLLQAPLAAGTIELTTVVGSMVAVKLVGILMGAAVIVFAFRIAGGRVAFEATLCAYMYMICPLYLGLVLLMTMIGGVVAEQDAEAARLFFRTGEIPEEVVAAVLERSLWRGAALVLFMLLMIAVVFGWPLVCWGAFRIINGVSRLRSALAYAVALCLFLFVLNPILTLLIRGLHQGDLPPIK